MKTALYLLGAVAVAGGVAFYLWFPRNEIFMVHVLGGGHAQPLTDGSVL